MDTRTTNNGTTTDINGPSTEIIKEQAQMGQIIENALILSANGSNPYQVLNAKYIENEGRICTLEFKKTTGALSAEDEHCLQDFQNQRNVLLQELTKAARNIGPSHDAFKATNKRGKKRSIGATSSDSNPQNKQRNARNCNDNTIAETQQSTANQYHEVISLSNSFDLLRTHELPGLADENECLDTMDEEPEFDSNPIVQEKIPDFATNASQHKLVQSAKVKVSALFLNMDQMSWTEVEKQIQAKAKGNFTAKVMGDSIKIQLSTIDDYRNVSRWFQGQNLHFHTYKLNEEKTLKVVIRHLPKGIPTDAIKEALMDQDLPVLNVHQMTSSRNGEKRLLPLYLVELTKDTKGKEIYNLLELLHVKIGVEPKKRSKEPTQCYKCQKYNHTQSSCYNKPRCVKCAEEHLTTECPTKGRIEVPKCCLCQGSHTANYRGCPRYPRKIIETQQILSVETNSQAKYTPVTESTSYAQILRTNIPQGNNQSTHQATESTNQTTETIGWLKEIIDWFKTTNIMSNLNSIMSLIKEFKDANTFPQKLDVGMKALNLVTTWSASL